MSENKHNEIMHTLGKIEGSLSGVHKELKRMNGTQGDHADSIKSLEASRNRMRGATKVFGIVTGTIATLVGFIIKTINS